ncbi:hypothetical protein [Labilithrix luteola]|nr:hypothetical protein [Labilithrix luteola]
MRARTVTYAIGWICAGAIALACGSDEASSDGASPSGSSSNSSGGGGGTSPGDPSKPPSQPPAAGALAGNPDGKCAIPAGAGPEDVSSPTTVIGTGTPASCTSAAFVSAVANGGVITFDCGPDPVTITLTETAKVYNDKGPKVVIDGGGKVTLSGGGKVRMLYQNSCSPELHGGADCNDQEKPALTVQNITFVDGSSKGLSDDDNQAGGGAIWVRGGRFKAYNARFFGNVCDDLGSDLGGGAIRVLDFPSKGTSQTRPVYIVHSTFGGENLGNACANGGALSSIGTSYTIVNSLFQNNTAVGHGANDGQGGNGGAIYNDGNTFTLSMCGTRIENNHANEGGSAVFYVSNDKTGSLTITDSTLRKNPKGTFETADYPGMFIIAKSGEPNVTNSTIE